MQEAASVSVMFYSESALFSCNYFSLMIHCQGSELSGSLCCHHWLIWTFAIRILALILTHFCGTEIEEKAIDGCLATSGHVYSLRVDEKNIGREYQIFTSFLVIPPTKVENPCWL